MDKNLFTFPICYVKYHEGSLTFKNSYGCSYTLIRKSPVILLSYAGRSLTHAILIVCACVRTGWRTENRGQPCKHKFLTSLVEFHHESFQRLIYTHDHYSFKIKPREMSINPPEASTARYSRVLNICFFFSHPPYKSRVVLFSSKCASCFFFSSTSSPSSFPPLDFLLQKRRSNRQVKRKKYAEELEARLSDDDVKVIVKAKKTNPAASKEPALQLFVVSNSASSTNDAHSYC